MSGIEPREVTITTVWPSVAAGYLGPVPMGQLMGRLFNIQAGFYIFTVGNLCLLLSIPFALLLYFQRLLPFVATRYRLTNERVVVEKGLLPREDRSVDLDRFNQIEIRVEPGYEWYYAGDLVFRLDQVETFRLVGIARPEAFRTMCLNAHLAHKGVQEALRSQGSLAAV